LNKENQLEAAKAVQKYNADDYISVRKEEHTVARASK